MIVKPRGMASARLPAASASRAASAMKFAPSTVRARWTEMTPCAGSPSAYTSNVGCWKTRSQTIALPIGSSSTNARTLSRFVMVRRDVGIRCRKRGKGLLRGRGTKLVHNPAGGRGRVLRLVDRATDDHRVRPRRDRVGGLSSLGADSRCQDESGADDSTEGADSVRSSRRRDDSRSAGADREAGKVFREFRCVLLASRMTEFGDDEDVGRAGRLDAGADGILSREGMTDQAGRPRSDRLLDDESVRVRDVGDLEVTQHVAEVRELPHDPE